MIAYRRLCFRGLRFGAAVSGLLLFSACGDPFALPPADISNDERVVNLWALTGTAVINPSAFSTLTDVEVRTDASNDFDFAVDLVPDSAFGIGGTTGDSVFAIIPPGALGFTQDAGVLLAKTTYDSLVLAPDAGYLTNKAVKVDSGSVVIVSSRAQVCNFGLQRHLYAKFRVDQVDRAQRKISTTMLTDLNCGYRGLQANIPQR